MAAGLLGLGGAFVMVTQTSRATFTATTVNGSNTSSAGVVLLADDDSSGQMFSVGAIKPGATGERCIVVTYNGTLAASIKLYGVTSNSTTLANYLQLTVDAGSGSSFTGSSGGVCTGFTSAGAVAGPSTLAVFGTTYTSFATGAGTWTPTANNPGQTRVYRFAWSLPASTSDVAQNMTATATFTWEARNT